MCCGCVRSEAFRQITRRTCAKTKSLHVQRKDIATTFQQYLILSFFANVPDRQRTLRELELGRSCLRVDENDDDGNDCAAWIIKHSAEDYKTGATYGERPPLPLLSSLTPDIDDFLVRWRTPNACRLQHQIAIEGGHMALSSTTTLFRYAFVQDWIAT